MGGIIPLDIHADNDLQRQSSATAQHEVVLVAMGKAQAAVITADAPNPIVKLAVEELVEHVKLATGVVLPVLTESAAAEQPEIVCRVYVGETQAAIKRGLGTDVLAPDAFRLLVEGNDVYVLGKEHLEQGYYSRLGRRGGYNGTLYGVYELLERLLHVRWLWPGDLGTFVPTRERVAIAPTDEVVDLKLKIRDFRVPHIDRAREQLPEVAPTGFSVEGLRNYWQDLERFMQRHRLGRSMPKGDLVPGHFFGDWWARYGKQHPEWFKMNADGNRVGPTMCVSNPDLANYIVNEIWDGKDINIRLGEADVRTYCHCVECMKLDEPLPEGWPTTGVSRPISNRYARFAEQVRNLARQRRPELDFNVTTFAYFNYMHEPTAEVDLNDVIVSFAPWGSGFEAYYPMHDAQHKQLLTTWSGWHRTGAKMFYRPNYLLGGYVMPHLSTHQAGEMFRHAAANGAVGVDFDSLWAQWAAAGPMLYMHMRLAVDPNRSVDELRREYFQGFGPAAVAVEKYFDFWEKHSQGRHLGGGNVTRAHMLYSPQTFAEAAELLEVARSAVVDHADSVYGKRIAFLGLGLEHARLAAQLVGLLDLEGQAPKRSRARFNAARAALDELLAFRRKHESSNFSDLIAAAQVESRRMELEPLLKDRFVPLQSDQERLQPWGAWFFRKDSDGVGGDQGWFTEGNHKSGIKNFDDGTAQEYEFDQEHWTPILVPARLAETSIGDYLGYGWYATTFFAPEGMAGQSALLNFQGVDEQAWIYINGRFIGEHTVESQGEPVEKLWDKPFTIFVPAGVIHGNGKNLLVVRTHSGDGASGIWHEVGLGHRPIGKKPSDK